ncbi:DUF971 domain-containing protein [Phragmitibacter flavus]|uniref:DUF971 domain-containing protein n=1 Tax=Phragmitibacter flavus TaxID=2576071 RepID=A0A5R8KBE9_9BACT|nr:DUF971 domain-containing protein [Phragmitibacter flavus]TLD69643.1 DUF971 domain-containing protein [Phragmitibacter flavus]
MIPSNIAAIGNEIAILWSDSTETYISMEKLRAASPSAENTGEQDLLGKTYGGTTQKEYPGVTVKGWNIVGNYAIQFRFSDGHNTGLYPFHLLRTLGSGA